MGGPRMGGQPMGGTPMGAQPFGIPMGAPTAANPGGSGALDVVGSVVAGAALARGGFKLGRIILGIAGTVVLALVIGIAAWYSHSHPSVRIVNTSGKDGLSVYIDGQPFAKDLKNAATENKAYAFTSSIAAGQHKVEAKDASGKVLESFTYDFKAGWNGFLYAPAKNARVCFFIQTDEYKTNASAPDTVKDRFEQLDATKKIWELPVSIDYWFEDSPESVTVKQRKGSSSKSVIKRALRQAACNDPNFQD